jgi:ethanolamine utilization protein EutQ (cupin superfamily)
MKTRTLLAAIATAAVAAVATPSLSHAQDTTRKSMPKTTESRGDVAMQPSFGSLMRAINSASARNDSIKALTHVSASNVQLVNVEDLLKGNDEAALKSALKQNEAAITTLRSTLGADSTISNVITTGGSANAATSTSTSTTAASTPLTANDIVAADVGPDGKVILYYWKKTS